MNVLVLSGDLGSGKSTVAKILAPKMNAKIYSTGQIMRNMAEKKGIPFVEFSKYAETHHEIDHEIDQATIDLCADTRENLLIDSRMAWHFVPDSFSVYMMVCNTEAAKRIMAAQRPEERYSSLQEATKKITDRRRSEKMRYSELYGVKLDDLNNYDYVIDTTALTPEVVAEKILAAFEQYRIDPKKRIEICPKNVRVHTRSGDKVVISGQQDEYYTVSGGDQLETSRGNGDVLIECEFINEA